MTGPPPEVIGLWLHSHEEDAAATRVFRPRSYSFRPARWRDAIELRPDGTCTWHGSSPDDRGLSSPGLWEDLGHGQAQITIEATETRTVHLPVQSWSADRLVVKQAVVEKG